MKFINILTVLLVYTSSPIFSQWINTNCSGTGATYDMIEAGGNLIVARGSIYSTADGTNWSGISTGASFGSCRTLKNFNGTIYAGYTGSDFYTSTNNGTSWTSLAGKSGLGSVSSTSLFKNANVLIYGINNGSGSTYYSTNNGTTWGTSQYNYGSGAQQGFENTCYDIVELNGALFHSTYKYVFKSVNSGATWSVVATAPAISPGTVTSLCKINGGLLLSIYGSGVYRTTDDGATWTKVLGGPLGTLSNNMTRLYYENGVAIAGGASSQVYISTDNGVNWSDITDTGMNTGDIVQSIKIFDNCIYVGTNTNVYKKVYDVGVKDNQKISFSIYPNPVNNIIKFDGLSSVTEFTARITNINGKSIKEETIHDACMDISELPKGIYFIELNNKEGKTGTTKFIKE